jgi:hypothetical protein
MNKRLAAGLLATGMTATLLGVSAGPAAATPKPCVSYPPNAAYGISRTPLSGSVKRGTVVATRGTLQKGGTPCEGYPMGFRVKRDNEANYTLRAHGDTDAGGNFRASWTADRTFRFQYYVRLNANNTVLSGISEIIAK